MKLRGLIACLLLVHFAPFGAARAQEEHDHMAHGGTVGALPEERRAGLLAGDGLGLAQAAELNCFPGPKHVLELQATLDLSARQLARVRELRATVLADARRLGAQIVAAEGELHRRFEHRHIDEAALTELTSKIGRLEGELRRAHLTAHLDTERVLSEAQTKTYCRERGIPGG